MAWFKKQRQQLEPDMSERHVDLQAQGGYTSNATAKRMPVPAERFPTRRKHG